MKNNLLNDFLLELMHPLEEKVSDFKPLRNTKEEKEIFKKELPEICKDKLSELKESERNLKEAKILRRMILKAHPELTKCELHILVGNYTFLREQENIKKWSRYWKLLSPKYKPPKKKEGFSDQDLQRARECPIQDLLEEPFRTAGANKLKVRCPFHEERTPSFIIYTNDNTAHCYGCQVHIGNAIDFVMLKEKIDFKEAVKRLI